MSDFSYYMNQQDKRRGAYNLYNYASQKLENETIKERYAEVISQYEPLIQVTNGDDKLRKDIDRILKYVVFGHKF